MPDHPYTDWLEHDAAELLAERVRDYWSFRGAEVRVWVEPVAQARQGSIYGVRSDIRLELPGR